MDGETEVVAVPEGGRTHDEWLAAVERDEEAERETERLRAAAAELEAKDAENAAAERAGTDTSTVEEVAVEPEDD